MVWWPCVDAKVLKIVDVTKLANRKKDGKKKFFHLPAVILIMNISYPKRYINIYIYLLFLKILLFEIDGNT